jgi:hypothetical protein
VQRVVMGSTIYMISNTLIFQFFPRKFALFAMRGERLKLVIKAVRLFDSVRLRSLKDDNIHS